MKRLDPKRLSRWQMGLLLPFLALSLLLVSRASWPARGQGNPVTTVSAASFGATVAPASIAAAFGVRLATGTEVARSVPLPTQLAGTTVRVNGEAAPLFFVSPGQVNYLIPPGTPTGTASIVVTSGDGTVSTGTAQIAPVAPALFTTESGKGPLAAQLLRIKANGERSFEPLSQYSEAEKRFITKPIDLGGPNEDLFLVLYLTGLRNTPPSSLSVNIGGVANPIFNAAPVSGLSGLDQVNVRLEPQFSGRGRITLFVRAAGYTDSNAGEFEIGAGGSGGGVPGEPTAPVVITRVPSGPVSVGEEIEIGGSGFAANPRENRAQIVAESGLTSKADVLGDSPTSLRIRVPYGAGTGQLKITRGPSEASAPIRVRTSISGFVEENIVQADGSTKREAIKGVTIRVRLDGGGELKAETDDKGSYVLKDAPLKPIAFIVDGSTANATPPFASDIRMTPVVEGRDTQYPGPIVLQRKDGANIAVGGLVEHAALSAEAEQTSRVTLTLPPGAIVRFPDNSTSGTLNVTAFGPGRSPANLPPGHFSSTIAQIAPLSATITPGAKLTFRNDDQLPANTQARLFRFEQRTGEIGSFKDVGAVTVSADGARIETAAMAITETSYYFVSIPRPTATINGRVVETDGRPVPRAIVQARGQTTFTDGFGGFVLRDVPVLREREDRLRVEVSYQHPDGQVSRKDGNEVRLVAGALATVTPEIVLDPLPSNFPPVILAPASIMLEAGETREFDFVVTDPNSIATPDVIRAGTAAAFTELLKRDSGLYQLRMSPGANAMGAYSLTLIATNRERAQVTTVVAVTVNQRSASQPVAQSQAVTMAEDSVKAIPLTGRDPAGRELRPILLSMPAHGCFVYSDPPSSPGCWRFPNASNLIYRPAPNFNGVDSFTFRMTTGDINSPPATVHISVNPVNDKPVLTVPGEQTVTAGESLKLLLRAADLDGEQELNLSATGLPPGATLARISGTTWQFNWTPTITHEGDYSLSFTVRDNGGPSFSDTQTVKLKVGAKWAKTSGPEGSRVISLLSVGGLLYAGTYGGGVYRSSDQGESWVEVNNGLAALALEVQVLHAMGDSLFAGTRAGVYRSTDKGQTWIAANNGLPTDNALGTLDVVALHSAGQVLVAAVRNTGVYRSSDQGRTWSAVRSGFNGESRVQSLHAVNNSLFAGTAAGVYRSNDQGQTWMAINNGLGSSPESSYVSVLYSLGNTLFAGTGGGVYRLNDAGLTWIATNDGLGESDIIALCSMDNILFAGTFSGKVYKSNNPGSQGQAWVEANQGLPGGDYSIEALHSAGNRLFAGGEQGLYRSTNQGQSWSQIGASISASSVPVLLRAGGEMLAYSRGNRIDRSTDEGQNWERVGSPSRSLSVRVLHSASGNLFAGTARGVYKSNNNGQSWEPVNNGLSGAALFIQALHSADGDLFAGTAVGVYRSSDQGQNWIAINKNLPSAALNVKALHSISGILFAGTGGGVYRSSDGGQNWVAVNDGLSGLALNIVALHSIGANLFAGTTRDGVYRLRDGEGGWEAINNGLPGNSFFIHTLHAMSGTLLLGTNVGVYRTTDQGQNWVAANNGLPVGGPRITTLYSTGNSLFAGGGSGVYQSSDQGQNWLAVSFTGLPEYTYQVLALHSMGGPLFAGVENRTLLLSDVPSGGGVYRLSSERQSWEAANNGLPRATLPVTAMHSMGNHLFAGTSLNGVYRSSDHGQTWVEMFGGLPGRAFFINALHSVNGRLFAGTSNGVYRSNDQGRSWAAVNNGLNNPSSLFIRVLHAIGNTLFAGTSEGVFRLFNNGENWEEVRSGLGIAEISALQSVANNLFAGGASGKVYRSGDQGQSWTEVSDGLPEFTIEALHSVGNNLFAATPRGVYRLDNQRQRWAPSSFGLTSQFVASLAGDEDRLFAGTEGNGVFVLSNNTQSWLEINANLPFSSRSVNHVIVIGSTLYVGTLGSGVYHSMDQGQSWTSLNTGLPSNSNIQSLVSDGATLWSAAFGDGVYRSTNQGANWSAVLSNKFVNKLFLSGATLYAGTDNGVFRSPDGGTNWTRLGGLNNLRVVSFTADAGVIYAGTDGSGVFRLDSAGTGWTQINRGLTSLSVTALGASNGVLYAGTTGGGVCVSRDGGANWTAVNNALPSNLNVYAFAVSGRKVYAGSIYGVFVTENQGQSWTQINAGLLNTFVTGLAVSGDQLFASTASGGVFVSRIPQQ